MAAPSPWATVAGRLCPIQHRRRGPPRRRAPAVQDRRPRGPVRTRPKGSLRNYTRVITCGNVALFDRRRCSSTQHASHAECAAPQRVPRRPLDLRHRQGALRPALHLTHPLAPRGRRGCDGRGRDGAGGSVIPSGQGWAGASPGGRAGAGRGGGVPAARLPAQLRALGAWMRRFLAGSSWAKQKVAPSLLPLRTVRCSHGRSEGCTTTMVETT
jgi:hypothetical protein